MPNAENMNVVLVSRRPEPGGLHGGIAGRRLRPERSGGSGACIRKGAKGLLKEVTLFDIYTGTGIPEGKKSVAFNLTLRADDRSLTAEEADADVKSILELLASQLGAVLR